MNLDAKALSWRDLLSKQTLYLKSTDIGTRILLRLYRQQIDVPRNAQGDSKPFAIRQHKIFPEQSRTRAELIFRIRSWNECP
jgi:hypothetical protein